MQHFLDRLLPLRSDRRLLAGYPFQFEDNLVPWQDPRAVCRVCCALHVDAVHLASEDPCPFALGAGLCPSCGMLYGATVPCVVCTEYREHFQVLASVVTWHARVYSKEEFAAVLKHLFSVSEAATALILDVTTARALPSGAVILFRAHARLQEGSVAGVNAVSRGADLPRYLAFARSAQTLDTNPNFGFLWDGFLQALAGRTLTPVNPRPCGLGPAPPAQPAAADGGAPPAELDVHAAGAINDFVNAWDEHHQIGSRDGRIQEPGAVARVEFPGGNAGNAVNPPLSAQGGPAQGPPQGPRSNQALPANPGPQFAGQYAYGQAQQFVPQANPGPQFVAYGHAQQFMGQQQNSMFVPQQHEQQFGYPQGSYYNQHVLQPHYALGQQFVPEQRSQQHFIPTQHLHNYPAGQPQQQHVPYQQSMASQQQLAGQLQQHFVPAQQFHNQQYPWGHQIFPLQLQPNPQFSAPNAPLHDFSFFPPNHSMNGSSAAQLGKSATVAGAHNVWLRKSTFSVSVKIQSYPRGAEGSDGKGRSRPFDIPYASNTLTDQYLFITDEPIQISQREHILICFVETCVAWARYILPLTGNDPRRLPIHIGQMAQVLANIRELAHTFGTSESVVLRVCHGISERNIMSCLNPGDTISLQDPLDVSTNYFQAALTKYMSDHRNRLNAAQHQGNRRALAIDGDPPARQEGAQQRHRPNNFRRADAGAAPIVHPPAHGAPFAAPAAAAVAANGHLGKCNKFWWGQPCFVHQAGQPCPYRHLCRTCRVVVLASEAAAHLQSHL